MFTADLKQRVENTTPGTSWKKNFLNGWWQHLRKNQQRNSVFFFFLNVLPMKTKANNRQCKCNHEASSIMFPYATPPDTTNKKGKWKRQLAWAVSFLNISISLTFFNIFSASVHMPSPQDGWSCHSIWQTDELKPKQCVFLSHLINSTWSEWNWRKEYYLLIWHNLCMFSRGLHAAWTSFHLQVNVYVISWMYV